ncbi:MAG: two-component system sensor histidine kinase NtrB [Desulfitobacteriia bacterium]|jgi:signal transduction histidine kinase
MCRNPLQHKEEDGRFWESTVPETAVLFLDCNGYCSSVNDSSRNFLDQLTGGLYSNFLVNKNSLGFNVLEVLKAEERRILQEHLQKCSRGEAKVKTIMNISMSQGGNRCLEITSFPECEWQKSGSFLTIVQDLNYIYGLRDTLTRLEELNLVGKIAGSVAHEVRNPLTVVRGHLQLLTWDKNLSQYYEHLETMIMEIDRAVEILNELLYMSRPSKPKMEKQNINQILNNLYQLLNAEALVNLHEVVYDLEEIPDVMLDKKKFRQVVLNLVNNGLQAMENHGKIIIRTYAKDDKVFFAVEDHGKGIPPEVLPKLGTPFFTTKPGGTGLGLASCYNIVAEHKAKMEVESSPQGTRFTVIFDAVS